MKKLSEVVRPIRQTERLVGAHDEGLSVEAGRIILAQLQLHQFSVGTTSSWATWTELSAASVENRSAG